MNVLIVYAHPSHNSFTYKMKESFLQGLKTAGHNCVVSDLYQMNFNENFSEKEYLREAFYDETLPVPTDVIAEQNKINNADALVFVYPVFWTEAPSKLVGWFQRVWTYGFAYGEKQKMKKLKKVLFLVTMGGSLKDSVRKTQEEAMKTVMLGDRINQRAEEKEMIFFDEMTRGYGNDNNREKREVKFLEKAYNLGLNL